jgi:nitrite reductase (NO-forming)
MTKIKLMALAMWVTILFLAACGGEQNQPVTKKPTTEAPAPAPTPAPEEKPASEEGLATKIAAGKVVYDKVCKACHQADGKGLPNAFPPIAKSDYLDADLPRAIAGVVNGLSGEITVNGAKYNQTMPKATLTDEEIADAFTFVLNSFGNKGGDVKAEEVKAVRK